MEYGVLYFTRTGNSKRVANKIADKIGVKPLEITDNKNWKGAFNYIKGGYYAMLNKSVEISVADEYKKLDNYIIVSPLWAGGPAPAIRTFLKRIPNEKVTLVITCDGSDADSAIKKYESKVGKFSSGYGIVKKLKNEDKLIDDIVKSLVNS